MEVLRMGYLVLVTATLLLTSAVAGCDGEEGSSSQVCEPGADQPCSCGGTTQGTRFCSDDGVSWGECQCMEPDVIEDMGRDLLPDTREDIPVDSEADPPVDSLEDPPVDTAEEAVEEVADTLEEVADTQEDPPLDSEADPPVDALEDPPVDTAEEDIEEVADTQEDPPVDSEADPSVDSPEDPLLDADEEVPLDTPTDETPSCSSIADLRAMLFPVPDSCDSGNPCPGALTCIQGECELPDFCDGDNPCPTSPDGIACVNNTCVQVVELDHPQTLCDVMVTYSYDTGAEAGFFLQQGATGPAIRASTAAGDSLDLGTTYNLSVTKLAKDELNLWILEYTDLTESLSGDVPPDWLQELVDADGNALVIDPTLADELVRLEGEVTWVSYDDEQVLVEYGTATTQQADLHLRQASVPPCTRGTVQITAMVTWDTEADRWRIQSWSDEDYTSTTLQCPDPPDADLGGPWLMINEVLADDEDNDANCDGVADDSEDDDEFIEVINISNELITLKGVAVWDEDQAYDDITSKPRYIFDDVLLGSGEAIVVFSGGRPGLCITDDEVDCDATCNDIDWPDYLRMETSFTGLDLDDGGEVIALTDPFFDLETRANAGEHLLHMADYGSASAESSNRNPDVVGVDWEDHSVIDVDPPYDDSPFSPGTTAHGFGFWGYCTADIDIQSLRDGDDDSGQLCGVAITYIAPGLGFFIQEVNKQGPAILVEDADNFENIRVGNVIDILVQDTAENGGNLVIVDSTSSSGDGYEAGSISFHKQELTADGIALYILENITDIDLLSDNSGDLVLDELIEITGVQVLEIDPDDDADPDLLLVTYAGLGEEPIQLFLPDGTNDFGGVNCPGSTFDIIRGFVRRFDTGTGNFALYVFNPDFWTHPDLDDPDIDHFVRCE